MATWSLELFARISFFFFSFSFFKSVAHECADWKSCQTIETRDRSQDNMCRLTAACDGSGKRSWRSRCNATETRTPLVVDTGWKQNKSAFAWRTQNGNAIGEMLRHGTPPKDRRAKQTKGKAGTTTPYGHMDRNISAQKQCSMTNTEGTANYSTQKQCDRINADGKYYITQFVW